MAVRRVSGSQCERHAERWRGRIPCAASAWEDIQPRRAAAVGETQRLPIVRLVDRLLENICVTADWHTCARHPLTTTGQAPSWPRSRRCPNFQRIRTRRLSYLGFAAEPEQELHYVAPEPLQLQAELRQGHDRSSDSTSIGGVSATRLSRTLRGHLNRVRIARDMVTLELPWPITSSTSCQESRDSARARSAVRDLVRYAARYQEADDHAPGGGARATRGVKSRVTGKGERPP